MITEELFYTKFYMIIISKYLISIAFLYSDTRITLKFLGKTFSQYSP